MWVVRIVNIYSLSNFQVCNIVLLTIVNMPHTAAAAAKSLQLCPNLCDPIDGSPAGSPIPAILQERTLEWVTISFSNFDATVCLMYDKVNGISLQSMCPRKSVFAL